MENSIQHISLAALSYVLVPIGIALYLLQSWSLDTKRAGYALGRMLSQLLLIGFVLNYIFNSDNAGLISLILLVMMAISSWIALNVIKPHRLTLLKHAFLAILLSSVFILVVVTQGVLSVSPWYQPQVILPLAGMIFATSMNSVSLAAERFIDEINRHKDYYLARKQALKTASIPVVNSLFAVGIVSLPGMMTGQILTGVSPHIAARYQIMVMAMLFSSAIIAAALFLRLLKHVYPKVISDGNTNTADTANKSELTSK